MAAETMRPREWPREPPRHASRCGGASSLLPSLSPLLTRLRRPAPKRGKVCRRDSRVDADDHVSVGMRAGSVLTPRRRPIL
uniref:Uncharacterized protein n=1 Tax=Arundo donax TaxID=35708 RepID=A0A0A9B0I6_ARUDO